MFKSLKFLIFIIYLLVPNAMNLFVVFLHYESDFSRKCLSMFLDI